jgi:hypothetical protein
MPYTSEKPPLTDTADKLRARIPGWGVDLDPKDRPSVPRERLDRSATGAHWDFPERQPEFCAPGRNRTYDLHIRLSEVARWSDLPSSRGAVLPAAAADRSHQSAPFQRVSSPARARPWTTARRLNVNCIQADMQDLRPTD